MKTIGLLGGMSWESTLEYYRIINQEVKKRLGGHHSAKIILFSLDFAEIEILQHQGKWDVASSILSDASKKLAQAGADFILICTNTMHKLADEIQSQIKIPILHIVDVIAEAIKERGLKKVGLLGTKFTMEEDFYTQRLRKRHGIDVLIPGLNEREEVHKILYDEFCMGKFKETAKEVFKRIIANLAKRGAEGIVLGCTEIPLIINQKDFSFPLFDSVALHSLAAVDFALKDDEQGVKA